MVDIASLSNDELRAMLIQNGKSVGPIGPSTRSLYEKQLMKLLGGGGGDAPISSPINVGALGSANRRTPKLTTPIQNDDDDESDGAVAQDAEDHMSSSGEEHGEESVRYYDEELVRGSNSSYRSGSTISPKSSSSVGSIPLIIALIIIVIFTVFLLNRAIADDESSNHEEL